MLPTWLAVMVAVWGRIAPVSLSVFFITSVLIVYLAMIMLPTWLAVMVAVWGRIAPVSLSVFFITSVLIVYLAYSRFAKHGSVLGHNAILLPASDRNHPKVTCHPDILHSGKGLKSQLINQPTAPAASNPV